VKRVIKPELLDHLPAEDLLAQGSRRDLQRLNAWMGSAKIMARRLSSLAPGPWQGTGRLVELGAGDGRFLSEVAKRLASAPPQGAVLVERLRLCSPETREAFSGLGWALEFATADVFDWLRQPTPHCEDWRIYFYIIFSRMRCGICCGPSRDGPRYLSRWNRDVHSGGRCSAAR